MQIPLSGVYIQTGRRYKHMHQFRRQPDGCQRYMLQSNWKLLHREEWRRLVRGGLSGQVTFELSHLILLCLYFLIKLTALYTLEKEMATHSNILVWRIPWIKKPGGLQSMGLQRVRCDWTTEHTHALYTYFKVLRFPSECQFHRAKVASDASQPVLDFSWCSDRRLMEKDSVALFCYSNSE